MDITEALRNDDLSKTDFFDFVTCTDVNDTTRLGVRSPPNATYIVDGLHSTTDLKETNNNHLQSADGFEHFLWGSGNAGGLNSTPPSHVNNNNNSEKDAVKLETAIFEDWNKLWGHAVVATTSDPDLVNGSLTTGGPGLRSSNTDGAIYTLTVLNGDHPSSWFTKPEDVTNTATVPPHTHTPQPMDIESLLNIMAPPTVVTNGFRTDNADLSSPPTETYTFVDENPSDPLLNESDDNYHSSLLRSALQGKASFLSSRYNIKIESDQSMGISLKDESSTTPATVTNADLIVPSPVLEDPPSHHDDASPSASSQALFASTGVLPSMFEPQNLDSEPSAHSMDELLLSQLDVTYDYEKLRRIEDEVAESVQQYCNSNPGVSNGVDASLYKIPASAGAPNTNITPGSNSASVSSAKNKKYSKRAKSASDKTGSATNGVRKERSLHYCTICSKGFKDKYSVNVHIRTHTGEKPFACTLCGKSFRQKAHLAKHYQTHAQKAALSTSPNHKATKR